jgi:tetratricopeptide (TPR) repeat protein
MSELIVQATESKAGGAESLPPLDELAPLPVRESGPATRCSRCGGRAGGAGGQDGLCERCHRLQRQEAQVGEDREWRVQTASGVILGPLTSAEVKQKYHLGEVVASDKLARGEGDFRLISSYPDFAAFFRRPGDTFQAVYRPPASSGGLRWLWLALGILVLGAGVGVLVFWPRLQAALGMDEKHTSVVEDILDSFSLEVPNPSGTSGDAVRRGRQLLQRDERLAYLEADRSFKAAVLLDPSNPEAIAGWVENRALLDRGAANVQHRKMALDLVDYALERWPALPSLLRAKAFLLYSLGRTRDAQEMGIALQASSGSGPEIQLLLAATYLETNAEMAADLARKALETNPSLNLGFNLMGEAHVRLGRFRAAMGFFDDRLQKDPSQVESLVAKANLWLTLGEFQHAGKVFEAIVAVEPWRVSSLLSLARIKVQVLGETKAALRLLDGALGAAEKLDEIERAALLAERSSVLRLLGQARQAREAAEESVRLDPSSTPALFARAAAVQDEGELATALGLFRALRESLPDAPELLGRLAEAEAQIPDFETAIRLLGQASEAAANPMEPAIRLAGLYLDLDNQVQALSLLRRIARMDPWYDETHQALQELYDGPGRMRAAVERAQRAALKNAEEPLALSVCGLVLWRAGQIEKARSLFQQALGQDPECFPANLFLGIIWLNAGQVRQAVQALERAHEADALHPVANRALARAYLEQGKLPRAENLVRAVLKADPGDLASRLVLAEILLARRKKSAAMEEIVRVYEGDSTNTAAKQKLFELEP